MCDFVSFFLDRIHNPEARRLLAVDLVHHEKVIAKYGPFVEGEAVAAEWTATDPENLWISPTDNKALDAELRKWVLDQWPNRDSLVNHLLRTLDFSGCDLYLSGTQIAALPEGLTVGGWLDLRNTQIAALPEGLTVGGSLYLSNTQIAALPEGLTVGGSLDLSGTQIAALPEGLTVGGWLDLRNTQIAALPEGLTVGGWLDLRNTQIAALPEGLTVGGPLDLSGTQIAALPEGLTVGGSLDLSGTQIKTKSSLPKHLRQKAIL